MYLKDAPSWVHWRMPEAANQTYSTVYGSEQGQCLFLNGIQLKFYSTS